MVRLLFLFCGYSAAIYRYWILVLTLRIGVPGNGVLAVLFLFCAHGHGTVLYIGVRPSLRVHVTWDLLCAHGHGTVQ
jgi:hypothetical protein